MKLPSVLLLCSIFYAALAFVPNQFFNTENVPQRPGLLLGNAGNLLDNPVYLKGVIETLKTQLKEKDEYYKEQLKEKDGHYREQLKEKDGHYREQLKEKDVKYETQLNATNEAIRQIDKLTTVKETQELILQKVMPYLAIRHKIESLEALLNPEARTKLGSMKFANLQDLMSFHTKMWLVIFEKTHDVRVKRMLKFLKVAKITVEDFCLSIGGFFSLSSDNLHVPPVFRYTIKQLVDAVKYNTGVLDPTTIKTVRVLKKI